MGKPATRTVAPAKPVAPVNAYDAKAVVAVLADQTPQLVAAARAKQQMATRGAFLEQPNQAEAVAGKVRTGQGKISEAEAQWMKALMGTVKDGYLLPRDLQERIARVERKLGSGDLDLSRSDVVPIVEYAQKIAADQKKALSQVEKQKQLAIDRTQAGKDYPFLRMKLAAGRTLMAHEKPQLERVLKLAEQGDFPTPPAEKAVIAQIREAMNKDATISPDLWRQFHDRNWARFLDMARPARGPASDADLSPYIGPEADKMRATISSKLSSGKTLEPAEQQWLRGASTVLARDRRLDGAALGRLAP
jgi:hypothetical protein